MPNLGISFEHYVSAQNDLNSLVLNEAEIVLPEMRRLILPGKTHQPLEQIIERHLLEKNRFRSQYESLLYAEKLFSMLDDLNNTLNGVDANSTINEYQKLITQFIEEECNGSHALFSMIWNALIAEPGFQKMLDPLFQKMFRPPSLGPNIFTETSTQSSTKLNDGRFFDPRNYKKNMILIRHGKAEVDSKQVKVGHRTPNRAHPDGIETTLALIQEIDSAITQIRTVMNAVEIDTSHLTFLTSQSPNTEELAQLVHRNLSNINGDINMQVHQCCNSQDFGFTTGQSKKIIHDTKYEADVKNPLYRFSGGESFMDVFLRYANAMYEMSNSTNPSIEIMCTHSSTLQMHAVLNRMMQRGSRSLAEFMSTAREYNSYKENQSTALMVGFGGREMSNYDSLVGTPEIRNFLV